MNANPIPFGRPWITDEEKKAVMDVLGRDVLTHGPESKAFEEDFAAFAGGGGHAVSVSSGMAALHLAYFQMGVGPGDEVIVPALTHVATVHAVEVVGATPVFVDCDPATGNISPEGIEAALTPRTKAIGLVHFVGIPCAMDRIMAVAEARGLKVVEDCAIAIGSRFKGKHVGLFGEAGCFSFYPVKQMTTGEGGMFITRHSETAERTRKARAFGVDRSFTERTFPGMYDVLSLGVNYRMSDIAAAIGRVQVRRLPEIAARRKAHFNQLKSALKAVPEVRVLDSQTPAAENSHYCLSAVLQGRAGDKRNEILIKMKDAGVGTSVYYPQPVPRMTYYKKKYGYDPKRFPQAEAVSDRSIALPVGPHLSAEDVGRVAETFIKIIREAA